MKRYLNLPFILACSALAFLAQTYLQAAPLASWEQIVQEATRSSKPILLEFTGSDWCPPCQMMEKTVFSTPEFKTFAEKEVVFVKLDFPRRKPQSSEEKSRNEALAQQFNIEGFPTMVVLDSQGTELGRQVGGMPGGPQPFIDWVKQTASLP